MYANIVLAGGGVKGTVLAGALAAAEDKGIEPVGFGGTSAGSIVATLAAVGYSGVELKEILTDLDFSTLLDDGGELLHKLNESLSTLSARLNSKSWFSVFALGGVAKFFKSKYGLYKGDKVKLFLAERIAKKLDILPNEALKITFRQLLEKGCKPLRVVATELITKRAVVFGAGKKGENHSVVEAVMASSCFPFVFQPVLVDDMVLSDGGLSSNLPSFLFEQEYRESRTPTLAFDLVLPKKINTLSDCHIDLMAFARCLLGSALEASDILLRDATPGVTYFPIETPEGIETLDVSLERSRREACFHKGYSEAASQLERYDPIKRTKMYSAELQKHIMTQYGPLRIYEPVLRALIQQLDLVSTGELVNSRAHMMLLTGRASSTAASTRIVTYSIGMDNDPDRDLELDQDAGCSGKAWETGHAAVADLEKASADPAPWKMSRDQHNKVPKGKKSMISVPITGNLQSPKRPIGTLSVDCETVLADTGWCEDAQVAANMDPTRPPKIRPEVMTVMQAWAAVIGAMLP